mgnify:CR=1 FL=1
MSKSYPSRADNLDAQWPVESFGACRNAKNCRNRHVPLANGYCVQCWDRGLGRPSASASKGKNHGKSRNHQ